MLTSVSYVINKNLKDSQAARHVNSIHSNRVNLQTIKRLLKTRSS